MDEIQQQDRDAVTHLLREVGGRAIPDSVEFAPFTDSGNAEVFADVLVGRLVFDHSLREWFAFYRHRWVRVPERRMIYLALQAAVRPRYNLATENHDDLLAKWARLSESARSLAAMIRVAGSMDALADDGKQWDKDPWLLGVPNGVVDLRTAKLRPGTPADRITKQTSVPYIPDAECPHWIKLITEAMPDPEVRKWRSRFAGYSVTGESREEVAPCDYGFGSNGKSLFREVARRVLGDYGWNIDASALLAERRGAHTTEIAQLEGRRLVTVSELGDFQLNEARLKAIVSRDAITARLTYKDDRSFLPTHKLWMAANNLPHISDATDGLWRRFALTPWPITFPQDDAFEHAVEAEQVGILRWLVHRAAEYAEHGLGEMPEAMVALREQYREDEDPLAEWRTAQLVAEEEAFLPSADARRAYRNWGLANGMAQRDLLSAVAFGRLMAKRYQSHKRGGVRGFLGVRLRLEEASAADAFSLREVLAADAE